MTKSLTPLEIALSDHRLPWPATIAEEIQLEERRLLAEAHGTAQTRKQSEVAKVLQILDEIERGRNGTA